MGWETFKGRKRRQPGEPAVTLTKAGSIGLNSAIVRDILDGNKFATLMFDPDKHLIGIKLSTKGSFESYPINVDRDNYASIAGVAFLKTYGIFPAVTRSFPASFDSRNHLIIIDVSDLVKKEGKKGD